LSGKSWVSTFSASVVVLPDQFLLLGVHRDDRLARGEEAPAGPVDVPELGIAVGVLLPFQGLGVGLQAVAEVVEQLPDEAVADRESLLDQGLGQVTGALASPPQRGHRIAAGLRGDQAIQGLQDRGVLVAEALAASPEAPDTTAGEERGIELLRCRLDRRARDARGPTDPRDAAVTQGACFGGEEEPPLPLVEAGEDRGELPFEFLIGSHPGIMGHSVSQEKL
jgi:hypothetical protein